MLTEPQATYLSPSFDNAGCVRPYALPTELCRLFAASPWLSAAALLPISAVRGNEKHLLQC